MNLIRHGLPVLFSAGFIAWMLYQVWPARIVFAGDKVIKKHKWKKEEIALADLVKIKFHYHAAVGFVCLWEFVSASGTSFLHEANDIDEKFLARLERHIPNFSAASFYKEFHDGDVVDTIDVWSAAENKPLYAGKTIIASNPPSG
jgi:hypothetical protein